MPDRWSDRLARIDQAVDRVMSETVRITPVVEGDYSETAADPNRLAFDVEGVLVRGRGESDLGGNSRHVRNVRIVTADAELHIQKVLLTGLPEVRKNDRVSALAVGETYKVERIDRSHPGRIVLHLSADGAAQS